MEQNIRIMNKNDVKRVLEIEQKNFSQPWDEAIFNEIIHKHIAYVMEHKYELIGYITAIHFEKVFYITNFAIEKNNQKKGYGKKLMQFFLTKYLTETSILCYLDVRESNKVAIHLYHSLGFQIFNRKKNYYHQPEEDALQMLLYRKWWKQ